MSGGSCDSMSLCRAALDLNTSQASHVKLTKLKK